MDGVNLEKRGDTSGDGSEVHKDTKYGRLKRKSEGAGDVNKNWRVGIRTITGKEMMKQTVKQKQLMPTITWTWATYVRGLTTGWYKLQNTSEEKSGREAL